MELKVMSSTVRAKSQGLAGVVLTPEQIAERYAVMADHPMSEDGARGPMPTFMGWNRSNWTNAPDPIVDHFGMRQAVDVWRREWDELLVSVSMPPEFDRGELLRRWKFEQEQRVRAHKRQRSKMAESPASQLAARA
jgi:hypothetical protein